jgi:hypothetical protein
MFRRLTRARLIAQANETGNDDTNDSLHRKSKQHNGGVDAAARNHSSTAAPVMMQNTLPPLASNPDTSGFGGAMRALSIAKRFFEFV